MQQGQIPGPSDRRKQPPQPNVIPWPLELERRTQLHWARRIFHMISGFVLVASGFVFSEKLDWLWFLGSVTAGVFIFELLRLSSSNFRQFTLRYFSFLMRQGEEMAWSGMIFYLLGCFLSALFFPRVIAILSILYLAVGDPVAALVGVRWGKHRYHLADAHRPKSLEGSAACGLICVFCTFVLTFWIQKTSGLELKDRVLFSILGGTGAMLGELIPFRTDDNMALPLLAGAFLWLSAAVLNLIPGLYI